MSTGFAWWTAYRFGQPQSVDCCINLLRHSLDQRPSGGTGILNQLCISYTLRSHLSSRLTLGGRTFPRKPWAYGDMVFHHVYRYLCLHSHFHSLHLTFPQSFTAIGTLSYSSLLQEAILSVCCLVPIIFGANSLDGSAVTHCLNDGCL